MWSTLIGLIRSVTEAFGVEAGTALIYTVGAAATVLRYGIPKISAMSRSYLFGAGSLFVVYEIVFSLAIGLSESARQTLEVGMLNYLWPCLVVLFSMWINKLRLNWMVWPGTAISIIGLYGCVAANSGLDFVELLGNVFRTPLPYLLGLTAAVTWGLYCNVSARYAKGQNGIPLFFTVIALILWVKFFIQGGEIQFPGYVPLLELLVLGAILGFSYTMWEAGLQRGNLLFLAVCSFFTPATSILFLAWWLDAMPPIGFWYGVAMVIAGSLLCWGASKRIVHE